MIARKIQQYNRISQIKHKLYIQLLKNLLFKTSNLMVISSILMQLVLQIIKYNQFRLQQNKGSIRVLALKNNVKIRDKN